MSKPPYRPISCAFHDRLEALATRGKPVLIVFRHWNGQSEQITSLIKTWETRAGEEYLILESGPNLRLDQLIEVNGVKRSTD